MSCSVSGNAGVGKSTWSNLNQSAERIEHVRGKNDDNMNKGITRKTDETGREKTSPEMSSGMARIHLETFGVNSRTSGINSKTTGTDAETFAMHSEILDVESDSIGLYSKTVENKSKTAGTTTESFGINSKTVEINSETVGSNLRTAEVNLETVEIDSTGVIARPLEKNNLAEGSQVSTPVTSDVLNDGDDALRSDVTFRDVTESDMESCSGINTVSDMGDVEDELSTDLGRSSAEVVLNMDESCSFGVSPSHKEASPCRVEARITGDVEEACQRCRVNISPPQTGDKGKKGIRGY